MLVFQAEFFWIWTVSIEVFVASVKSLETGLIETRFSDPEIAKPVNAICRQGKGQTVRNLESSVPYYLVYFVILTLLIYICFEITICV